MHCRRTTALRMWLKQRALQLPVAAYLHYLVKKKRVLPLEAERVACALPGRSGTRAHTWASYPIRTSSVPCACRAATLV